MKELNQTMIPADKATSTSFNVADIAVASKASSTSFNVVDIAVAGKASSTSFNVVDIPVAGKASSTSFNVVDIPVADKASTAAVITPVSEIPASIEISSAKKVEIMNGTKLVLDSRGMKSDAIELRAEEGYTVTIKSESEMAKGCINVGTFSPKKAAILGEGEDFYASEIRLGDANIVPSEGDFLHIFTTPLGTDAGNSAEGEAAGGGGAILGATTEG